MSQLLAASSSHGTSSALTFMALAVPAKEPSTPSGMEIDRVMAPSVSTESVAMVITTVVLQMGEILSAPALVDGPRHAELVHDGEGGMTGYLVWLPADRQVTGANAPRAKNGPRTNVNQQVSGVHFSRYRSPEHPFWRSAKPSRRQ